MQLCRVYARDPHRQTRIGVRGNSVWFHGTLFRQVSSVSPRVPSSLHQLSAYTRVSFRLCTAVNIRTFVDRVDIYLSACTRMHVVTFVRRWNRTTRTPHRFRKTLFAFAIRERARTQAISERVPVCLVIVPFPKGFAAKEREISKSLRGSNNRPSFRKLLQSNRFGKQGIEGTGENESRSITRNSNCCWRQSFETLIARGRSCFLGEPLLLQACSSYFWSILPAALQCSLEYRCYYYSFHIQHIYGGKVSIVYRGYKNSTPLNR